MIAFWITAVGLPVTLAAGAVGFAFGARPGLLTATALALAWTGSGVGIFVVTRPSHLETVVAAAQTEASTASCHTGGSANLCLVTNFYGKTNVCVRLVHDRLIYLSLPTCGLLPSQEHPSDH